MAKNTVLGLGFVNFEEMDVKHPFLLKSDAININMVFDERRRHFSGKIMLDRTLVSAFMDPKKPGFPFKTANQYVNVTRNGTEVALYLAAGRTVFTRPGDSLNGRYSKANLGASLDSDVRASIGIDGMRNRLGITYHFTAEEASEDVIPLSENKKVVTSFQILESSEIMPEMEEYVHLGLLGKIVRQTKGTLERKISFAVLTATGIIWRFTLNEETGRYDRYEAVAALVF